MNDVNSEGVHGIATNVIPVDPGDQDLSLVIVNEEASDHFD